MHKYFETRERDGKPFVALKDNAPESLRDFVREVHNNLFNDCLLSDWVFEAIIQAFSDYDDYENKDSFIFEVNPNDYHEIIDWLNEPFASGYCNNAFEVCGYQDFNTLIKDAQKMALEDIRRMVVGFMQDEGE